MTEEIIMNKNIKKDIEILIEGIDVSECDFLWKEKLPKKVCNNSNLDCDCISNPNCYFKRLKRKEQECEELYKQVKILTMQLENFNEKLLRNKAIIEFADCPYYSYGDNTIEPTCTKNFCYDVKSCDHKNMVKYQQALDEIEKIANKQRKFDLTGRTPLAPVINEVGGDFIDILDIINKAKENEYDNM